jgi:hypothetical protein
VVMEFEDFEVSRHGSLMLIRNGQVLNLVVGGGSDQDSRAEVLGGEIPEFLNDSISEESS